MDWVGEEDSLSVEYTLEDGADEPVSGGRDDLLQSE